MTPTIEPGRTAYEARFAHERQGSRGTTDAWDDLPESARAVWRRVEEAVLSGTGGLWFDMPSAPKDGRKVDLLFPYPRGRQNDCFWGYSELAGCRLWIWRRPTWSREPPGGLLPEKLWTTSCYPNMEPLGWRFPVPAPAATPTIEVGEADHVE